MTDQPVTTPDEQSVLDLYERWVKAGPPPLGVSLARWWDHRLIELREAICLDAEEPEEPARAIPDNSPTSSDTTDNPATVTNPAYLRQQYAQAIRAAACTGDCGMTEADCIRQRIQPEVWHHGVLAEVSGTPEMLAETVLNVRDRHVLQLQQRLQLADATLTDYTETESADAAAGSYALRAETAEWQRDRHAAAIDRVRALAVEYPVAIPTNLIDEALNQQEQQ